MGNCITPQRKILRRTNQVYVVLCMDDGQYSRIIIIMFPRQVLLHPRDIQAAVKEAGSFFLPFIWSPIECQFCLQSGQRPYLLENEPCYIVTDALETAMTTFPGMAEKFFSSVENKKKFDRKDWTTPYKYSKALLRTIFGGYNLVLAKYPYKPCFNELGIPTASLTIFSIYGIRHRSNNTIFFCDKKCLLTKNIAWLKLYAAPPTAANNLQVLGQQQKKTIWV